jgi:hypothetical protein
VRLAAVPPSARLIELLRSQDQVVLLLYHKTFPVDDAAAATPLQLLKTTR